MFSYRSKQMKKMVYRGPRHWSNFPTYFSLIKLCQLNLYEVIQMSWDGSFAWLVIQLLVPVWWKTWKEVEIEGLVRTLCFGFKCLWNSRWEHECTLKKNKWRLGKHQLAGDKRHKNKESSISVYSYTHTPSRSLRLSLSGWWVIEAVTTQIGMQCHAVPWVWLPAPALWQHAARRSGACAHTHMYTHARK